MSLTQDNRDSVFVPFEYKHLIVLLHNMLCAVFCSHLFYDVSLHQVRQPDIGKKRFILLCACVCVLLVYSFIKPPLEE
jgi:hypothetical protein